MHDSTHGTIDFPQLRDRSLLRGVAPKRNVFVGKNVADLTTKSKYFLPTSYINWKINTRPWPKTLQKDTIQLSHVLYHFCDTARVCWLLVQFSANWQVSRCLHMETDKFHVVCTCTFYQADWLLTLLFSLFEWAMLSYYPTIELFCFSFTQRFTYSKFCLPNPFSFRCH